jgi:archaellum component FlaC
MKKIGEEIRFEQIR